MLKRKSRCAMRDQEKTREQLACELTELRRRVSALEASETEWRQTEEALQGNEERFRLLVEAIPQPIWRSDAEGNVTEFNRRWYEYTGQTAEEAKGNGWTKALHPDEAAMVVQAVRASMTSGATFEIVNRLRRGSDGSYRWHLARAVPMNDRGGKIIGWFGCATDIDDQKQAEAALRERETQLLEAQEVANLGFHVVDLATGRITTSTVLDRIFGIPVDYERTLDKWADLVHPDERQEMLDYLKEVVGEKKPFDREYRIIRYGDKQVRWVHGRGRLQFNEDGQPISLLGTVQDITERQMAEAKIEAQHATLEGIVESTTHPVFSLDRNYCYTSFNRSHAATMKAIYGADIELGKSILDYPTTPQDRSMAKANLDRTLRGERLVLEEYVGDEALLRPCFEISHNPIKGSDGEVIGVAVFAKDITERKRAEVALMASEERFRQAMEATNDGLWDWNVKSGDVYYSPAYSRMLGYEVAEFPSRTESWMDLLHPDDRARAISMNQACIENRIPHFEVEFRMRTKGGEWRTILGRGKAVSRDASGQATRMIGTHVDITERKRAEEALLASEERFRAFMNNTPALAWMKDEQGRHVYVNAPHEKRFGRLEDRQGKTDFDLWPRETAEQFWKNDQAVLAGNTAIEVLEEIVDPEQGRTYWWNFKFPFQDASGKRYVGGVGIDITARKRAEEALQKAHDELEQKVQERTAELAIFKKFAEASGLGFGMTGLDGRIAYVNSAWLRLVGESQVEDVIGQHISTYCPKEYWERRNTEVVPAVLQKGLWQGEFSLVSRDGRRIPAIHSLFPIRDKDGNLVQLGAVVTDITQRKQAEEALRQSDERYELAVRGAGVGIWDYDICTGKVYYSPRWKTLFGYDENEIGDRVDDWANLLHPDERDRILTFQDDFLAGTSPTVTVEYRLRHKDGSYRWIVATGLVLRDEQGKAYRFVGSHGDITDRKHAEEALERERQSLWKMLQASDHERQIISYDIHDGLAQYLAAAGMQFQAHDSLRENSPDEARKAYETAVELVRQSHSEARRLINEVRPPVIDENGIETAISHLIHEQRRHGGPKIESFISVQFGRLPSILENALYRIAQEALTNACKHSKSKKVTVTMTQEGQDVRLEVQDWGIGFDPESIEKGHFGVEGIRQRVRLLGGRLTIESKPGTGTLVQVVVPIVEKQTEG